MRKLLHIASFIGNIGDFVNHEGFRLLRKALLNCEYSVTRIEIREVYNHVDSLNSEKFIEYANTFDLIVIGGGGFFELINKDSVSGTSIYISLNTLSKIRTKILFYSLGFDIGKDYLPENTTKFKNFLSFCMKKNNIYITFRNDGSISNLEKLFPLKFTDKLLVIPDGGFFYKFNQEFVHNEIIDSKFNILINLAGDMIDTRFSRDNSKFNYNDFTFGFAKLLIEVNRETSGRINYIFIPHLYRDLTIITDIVKNIPDLVVRNTVSVSSVFCDEEGFAKSADLYNSSNFIIANRFHSNILSMISGKKYVGVANYPQIRKLYEELGQNNYLDMLNPEFFTELKSRIIEGFSNNYNYEVVQKELIDKMLSQAKVQYNKINTWLNI